MNLLSHNEIIEYCLKGAVAKEFNKFQIKKKTDLIIYLLNLVEIVSLFENTPPQLYGFVDFDIKFP